MVVGVATAVLQCAAGLNVADHVDIAGYRGCVTDASTSCHPAKPGEFFHYRDVASKGAHGRIYRHCCCFNLDLSGVDADIGRFNIDGIGSHGDLLGFNLNVGRCQAGTVDNLNHDFLDTAVDRQLVRAAVIFKRCAIRKLDVTFVARCQP